MILRQVCLRAFLTASLGVVSVTALHAQGPAPAPDLAIGKTHIGDFVQGQTGATYTITVRNVGTVTSFNFYGVNVLETLPAGLQATSIGGTGWLCTQPTGPCRRSDDLPAGASFPSITLTVNVANDAPSSVTNTATVNCTFDACDDANPANDTATDPTTILIAGAPQITSLGSSILASDFASFPAAITSGTPINAFKLYIFGNNFDPNQSTTVTWLNTSTHVATVFSGANVTLIPGQITVIIPNSLFSTLVNSPVNVQITVGQQPIATFAPLAVRGIGPERATPRGSPQSGVSNPATFLILPPLASLGPSLPSGAVGIPYSQNYFTGGTGPYQMRLLSGALPGGLAFSFDATKIAGTPNNAGTFPFQPQIFDVWGNYIAPNDTIQIATITPPTIASVVPNSTPAGISSVQIAVNGSNFTPPPPPASNFVAPGSVVNWTAPNSAPVPLTTTFVSPTQLTAAVPGNLLTAPLTATITVSQSGGINIPAPVTSNGAPFTVNPPSISVLTPAGATAGSPAFTLTVSGANFVNNAQLQASSQVFFGGTQLVTTFVNSGTLTAPITSAMIATPGPVAVVVVNPGGSRSAAAAFTVSGAPALLSLNPNSAIAGSPAFTLTVTGTNFTNGTSIRWNGTALPTTCVNGNSNAAALTPCASNQLSTTVAAGLILTPGTAQVSVITADGVVTPSLPFTIFPRLLITTAALPNGLAGTNYSFTLTAGGGVTPYAWSAAGLPSPLTVNPGSGVISGVPATGGNFTVNVTVTDQSGQAAAAQFPLTIIPKLVLPSAPLPNGIVGTGYSFTFTPAGGLAPLVWSATGLPAGLAMNAATGTIGGIPTASGAFTLSVTVSDSSGQTATTPYSLTIVPKLAITTTALPNGIVGTGYSFTATATGGLAPLVWSAAGLPGGLSINAATGTISGIPTASGSFTVTVTVKDNSGQTATAQLPLTVVPKLFITSGNLPGATAGVFYSFRLTAIGGIPPYLWAGTGLAPGLTLNPQTGDITGTPAAASSGTVSVNVTDQSAQTASAQFPFTAAPPPIPPLQIVTSSLPTGTAGAPYGAAVAASGGSPDYTFSIAGGALPAGVSLSGNGGIGGTPTTPGQFRVTVRVTDSAGATATRELGILINPAPVVVTGAVSDVVLGADFSFKFGATGGVPPYVFGAGGSLPGGRFTSDGTLSGTATTLGTFTFNVSATDSLGTSASRSFTVKVTAPPLLITTAAIGGGAVGVAFSAPFSATGGVPPYTWSASGGPGGLGFSGNVLSGTPTVDGTFTIGVTVTDSAGTQASKSFTLIVATLLQISTTSLGDGVVGSPYSASLSATGGVTPYSFSVSGLPDGISASSSGALSGTPAARGSFPVSVKVTDANGTTASKSFTLTVAAPPLVITTRTLPNATVGTPYSMVLQATGGVPPYNWSATGLPTGIDLAADGTLSGTARAAGTASLVVTLRDSAGSTGNVTIPLTIVLPPPPNVTVTGVPANATSTDQANLKVALDRSFPVDVTVTLNLTVAPVSGPPPQDVQFASGGQSLTFVVPANTSPTPIDVFLQVGTVAGTITMTERLTIGTQDITPSPAPTQTIQIATSAPVLTGNPSVTATRNATGFTVVATGYSNTREISQAVFQFTAAAGTTLQTSTITVSGDTLFAPYYQSAASNATGGSFRLTQPFTVQGSTQGIVSLTLTLVNRIGSSRAVTVNLQ